MQVMCGKCGAAIAPDDIDLKRSLAKCAACGELFSCASQLTAEVNSDSRTQQRGDLPPPKGVHVYHEGDTLRIVRRWFGIKWIAMAVLCLLWSTLTVLTVYATVSQLGMSALLPALGFVLLDLGLVYVALAGFLNSTTVAVAGGVLTITRGPLRFPGNKRLAADTIAQLYTKEHKSSGGSGAARRRTTVSYTLRATTTDGRDVKLVGQMLKPEWSLYIEQQIEAFLGIRDRAITGEVRRS